MRIDNTTLLLFLIGTCFFLTLPLQSWDALQHAFPRVSGLYSDQCTKKTNDSGKCRYASSKCGEFNCHPAPPFTNFATMLFFDCVAGCDRRSGTRHAVVSRYSSSLASSLTQSGVT